MYIESINNIKISSTALIISNFILLYFSRVKILFQIEEFGLNLKKVTNTV